MDQHLGTYFSGSSFLGVVVLERGKGGVSAIKSLEDNIAWLDNMITYNEKRRHPRRKVALTGHLKLQKFIQGAILEVKGDQAKAGVLDMSVSGAGILTHKQMGMGQLCRVVCPLKGEKLSLNLKVVRFSRQDKVFRYGCEMTRCEKIV